MRHYCAPAVAFAALAARAFARFAASAAFRAGDSLFFAITLTEMEPRILRSPCVRRRSCCAGRPCSAREKFRGLWHRGGVCDELAALCRKIPKLRFWPEGWLAVRQTLDFDGKGMEAERLAQIVGIEQDLRPAGLSQKVRSIVLPTRMQGIDFEDLEEHTGLDILTRMARTEALAKHLGKAVATDEAVLASLLPALVGNDGRLWSFSEGLLDGTTDAAALWDRLVAALYATEESLRKPEVLRGFLRELHAKDPALATALLDSSVEHETLAYLSVGAARGIQITSAPTTILRR